MTPDTAEIGLKVIQTAPWGGDAPENGTDLETLLFETTKHDAEAHCYAVIDAAKVFALKERLEATDLEHQCLFKGQAAENLADVAPWIVKLDEASPFTSALFSRGRGQDDHMQLWDREVCIVLQTAQPIADVVHHLRKFTKVARYDGRQIFLRFYDPVAFGGLLQSLPTADFAKLIGPYTWCVPTRDGVLRKVSVNA